MQIYEGHHIWCNTPHVPLVDCKMCARLKEQYPEDGDPVEVMAKHFPSATIVPGTGGFYQK